MRNARGQQEAAGKVKMRGSEKKNYSEQEQKQQNFW